MTLIGAPIMQIPKYSTKYMPSASRGYNIIVVEHSASDHLRCPPLNFNKVILAYIAIAT